MAKTIGSFDLASLKNLRDDVTQYFWFESNSSSAWGSGAHVTLYPESQFTNPSHANYMKGQNIIMNTDGFSIRNGGLPMMVLDNDSLDFNVVDTTDGTYTNVASFGATSAQIGQTSGVHTIINTNGLQVFSNATDNFIDLRTSYARFGSMCYFNANTFQIARLNGTYRSMKYNLEYPFADGLFGDDIQPLQIYQHTNTDNEDLFSRIPRLLVVNLQAGQSVTTKIEPETSTGMLLWNYALEQEAIRAAYDANGNQITTTGITFSMNQTTLAVTISVASSYTGGTVHSVLLGLFGASVYGSTIVGNWHDYSNWDTTNMPFDTYGYWQDTVGWMPYPFVVGIGQRVYDQGRFKLQRANGLTVDWQGNVDAAGSVITPAKYNDAYNAGSSAGYSVTVPSLAGSTYLGQAIRLATVESTSKFPIFNGFDISGTGTARIHTLAHYIYKSTYNGQEYWTAYIKMRNDNTTAISNFTVTAYIAWV